MIQKEKESILKVLVKANAKSNKIINFKDNILIVSVQSPAKEGKANKELINFLAEILNIGKSKISFKSGQNSQHKLLVINGFTKEELIEKLLKIVK